MFSLVKGTMITVDKEKLGEILGISSSGLHIFNKSFSSLSWSKSEAFAMLFRVKINEVYRKENSFPINCLTPRAHVLAKIAQFNFLP